MKNYYFLFFQWLKRDFDGRYRGSLLGLAWPALQPLIQTAVFTLVLHHFMKIRWLSGGGAHHFADGSLLLNETALYAFNVLCGLAVFNYFSEILNKSPAAVLAQPNLITKVRFPLLVLPLTTVGAALIVLATSVALLTLVMLMLGMHATQVLWLPLWFLPVLIYGMVAAITLSAFGVFLRDIAQVIPSVVSLLFFITPIFYPTETIPSDLRFLAELNPIAWSIDSLRLIVLGNQALNLGDWVTHLGASTLLCMSALTVFSRLQKGFADVV